MRVLREGAKGDPVDVLQKLLKQNGFNPGKIDGDFGPATKAAVMAFQRSRKLLTDGICGPVTWHALGRATERRKLNLKSIYSVGLVAKMFPFTPLAPIKRHLGSVLSGLERYGLVDKPMVLSALATIRAETEGFVPLAEFVSRYNTSPDAHPFDLYDFRHDLGNRGRPDGYRYRGRGFIQLTGRHNYQKVGNALGLGDSLLEDPDMALEPDLSSDILAAFLKPRAKAMKLALLENDYRRARRLVNGGSHGLARFVDAYKIGFDLVEDEIWIPVPKAKPVIERFH